MPVGIPVASGSLAGGGSPVNGAIGYTTQAADTIITAVVQPHALARAKVWAFDYRQAGTAHTLSLMTGHKVTEVGSNAASGQAVVNMKEIHADPAGTVMAAGDIFLLKHSISGEYTPYVVLSVSGLAVTFTTTLSQQVLENTKAYYLGAPGDYAGRTQYVFAINTTRGVPGGDERRVAATAMENDHPILFHSNNATAAGFLEFLQYGYTIDP